MKKFLPILTILFLIFPILAQNVIEPIPSKSTGVFSGVIGFIAKYWLWFIVIAVAGVIIVFIILLIKRMKVKVDVFLEDYKKVKSLCKFQKDPTIKEVWLIHDKGMKYLGKYLGECITQDGFQNIRLWKYKKWYLFAVPIRLDFFDLVKEDFIIRCNLNKLYKYKIKKEDGTEETKTVELTHDISIKDGDKIIIKGVGIERVRYFFYPVLRDKAGNIVDGKLEVFEREKDGALINTLYAQVEDFANISRELINMNPYARWVVKTNQPIGKPQD
jgi:hypothetical protein